MPVKSKSTGKSQNESQRGWTTKEQLDWLSEQIPEYLAQRGDKDLLKAFWISLYRSWFERWPVEGNQSKDKAAKEKVRAVLSFNRGQS